MKKKDYQTPHAKIHKMYTEHILAGSDDSPANIIVDPGNDDETLTPSGKGDLGEALAKPYRNLREE